MSDASLLGAARSEIDRIDREIVALLAARRRLVGGIARAKRAAGTAALDAAREASLRSSWSREAEAAELPSGAALVVLDAILGASREYVRAICEGDATGETD